MIESLDRGIDRPVRQEEVSDFEESFKRYIAGDEGVDDGAKYFLDDLTFFVTEFGQHGMARPWVDIQPGDSIVTIASTPVPFIVRNINPGLVCSHCDATVSDSFHTCNICVDVFIVCDECFEKGCPCEQPELDLRARRITLIGDCYLHGAMTGDAVRAAAKDRFGDETGVDDVLERVAIYRPAESLQEDTVACVTGLCCQ